MLLEYLENLARESLQGEGMAYVIDMPLVLKYVVPVFIAHFLICLAVKRREFSPKKYFIRAGFAFYFVVIILFTLLPIYFPGIGEPDVSFSFSLLPLLAIFLSRAQLINVAGNIILFMPISVLGYINGFKIFKKWGTTAILMLVLSLLIEGIQYFEMAHGYTTMAVVDIIDVITNVIGGLLGLVLVKFLTRSHNNISTDNKEE